MTNKNLAKIILNFKNCDEITIESKDIIELLIEDIKFSLGKMDEGLVEILCADTIVLKISETANKAYLPFEVTDNKEQTIFDRITAFDDIFSVDLIMADDKKHTIYTHWIGKSIYINYAQTSFIEKGDLYILIKENGDVSDYF